VTGRTLSARELNRALLARQMLLQAQYAPSTYIGLWSRVRGLERASITRALEERTIVHGTLLRGTIHVVSRADYWAFARGPREERRTWALRDPVRRVTAREMAGAARHRQG
jgi:Winged helix DNA-binding domain